MGSKRQAFVWAVFGQTGSGKTSSILEFAKEWRRANPDKRVIGFDPHGNLEDAGILNHTIEETDDNWAQVLMTKQCVHCNKIKHPEKDHCIKCGKNEWKFKFEGCLLILDDYRSLIAPDTTPRDVLRLFALKRKIGLDIILIMHNPEMLHKRLGFYPTAFFIFATESSAGNFSSKIHKYVPCQKAANLINQYVMELGGVDSDKYRNSYPNFPYIMVTNDSNDLNFMNMDKNIVAKLKQEGKI